MQFLPWGRWVGGGGREEGGRNYNKPIFERSDVQGRGRGRGRGLLQLHID